MSSSKIDFTMILSGATDEFIKVADYETLKESILARKALPTVVKETVSVLKQAVQNEENNLAELFEADEKQQQVYDPLGDIDIKKKSTGYYRIKNRILYQKCIATTTELEQEIIHLQNQRATLQERLEISESKLTDSTDNTPSIQQQFEALEYELLQLDEQITKREKQLSRLSQISRDYEAYGQPTQGHDAASHEKNTKESSNEPAELNKARLNYLIELELSSLRKRSEYYKAAAEENSYETFLETLSTAVNYEQKSNLSKSQVEHLKQLISLNSKLTSECTRLEKKKLALIGTDCNIATHRLKGREEKRKRVDAIEQSIERDELRTRYASYAAGINGLGGLASFILIAAFATNPLLFIIIGVFIVGGVASMIAAVALQIQKHLHNKELTKVNNQEIEVPEKLKSEQREREINNEIAKIESNIEQLKSKIEQLRLKPLSDASEANNELDNPNAFFNQKQKTGYGTPKDEITADNQADLDLSQEDANSFETHNRL